MKTSRRTLLTAGLVGGTMFLPGWRGLAVPAGVGVAAAVLRRDPFTLGVASGDPSPAGFVLWTRLAVDPHAEDGRGGMPTRSVEVEWQVATDPTMVNLVRTGKATAKPAFAHAIHVVPRGLAPGREYWYRFRAEGHLSKVGRTLTAPANASSPTSLAMSFVSCAHFEHGYFTAYRRLAQDRPDLVLHLGDYQYEYGRGRPHPTVPIVRQHEGPATKSLAEYRRRHAQYKSDRDLQKAHAIAPWLVVFDDHEVANNWAGDTTPSSDPDFLTRRAAAFRAYYENMPLRARSVPSGPDMQLFRRVRWGDLATFHMLDTRQFRDPQACGGGFRSDCPAVEDADRSITGREQEKWLLDGFRRSAARWDVVGQQVFFSQRDIDSGPLKTVSTDAWDGYAASRRRITQGWVDAGVRNPVVLTGDVHAHWAADLKLDYDDPTSDTVGSELVCSSISTGGDGADDGSQEHPWLQSNPHLKFQNNLRGYVNTTITPETMTADFRSLRKVSVAGERPFTRASFAIEDGKAGLHQTYDNPPSVALADTAGPAELARRTIAQES